jgi:hypothetical protein
MWRSYIRHPIISLQHQKYHPLKWKNLVYRFYYRCFCEHVLLYLRFIRAPSLWNVFKIFVRFRSKSSIWEMLRTIPSVLSLLVLFPWFPTIISCDLHQGNLWTKLTRQNKVNLILYDPWVSVLFLALPSRISTVFSTRSILSVIFTNIDLRNVISWNFTLEHIDIREQWH